MIERVVQLPDGRFKIYYKSGITRTFSRLPKGAKNIKIEVFTNDSSKEQKSKNAFETGGKSETKTEYNNKKCRGCVIACILYPDNVEQMQFFDWLKKHERLIYILHKKENTLSLPFSEYADKLPEENHDYKSHYHVMLFYPQPVTVYGFLKSSAGCLKHAEIVSDRRAYCRYMIHDTYASLRSHKIQYQYSDIKYTDIDVFNSCLLVDKCDSSLGAFAQITSLIDENFIVSLPELIQTCKSLKRSDLLSFALNHGYIVGAYIKDNRLIYCGK